MANAVINVSSSGQLSLSSGGTQFQVESGAVYAPEGERSQIDFKGSNLGGIKVQNTQYTAGQSVPSTPFRVETISSSTITMTDDGTGSGPWEFSLEVDGQWRDPQIYNRPSGPPD